MYMHRVPLPRRSSCISSRPLPPSRQSIQQLASDFLSDYVFLTVGRVGSTNDFITQRFVWVEEQKKKAFLLGMMLCKDVGSTLVFVNHKQDANSLGVLLKAHGIPANSIHGDRTQAEREDALWAFKKGTSTCDYKSFWKETFHSGVLLLPKTS